MKVVKESKETKLLSYSSVEAISQDIPEVLH